MLPLILTLTIAVEGVGTRIISFLGIVFARVGGRNGVLGAELGIVPTNALQREREHMNGDAADENRVAKFELTFMFDP